MDHLRNREVVQAVLIADNNIEYLVPISDDISTSLLPVVNVPLLDYALESLNRSEIEEVFVFASTYINDVRNHIKERVASKCSWSVNMTVHVIGGETARCLGDALRDIDAKGLIRGHFILMGADTVTNANLLPILEAHKKSFKSDKGCTMTVVFKEAYTIVRTGDEVMIATDVDNNRLHFHQRVKPNTKEQQFTMPLEVFLNNSHVALHHNLVDPQIAVCSPTLLALFSDNFDFATRDDFIRGLLINEEILDSRIYVSLLPTEQYARKVSNWLSYQIVSSDVINRWAYPLVPDTGVCTLYRNYQFLRNNIYKNEEVNISKVKLEENVVIQAGVVIGTGSRLSFVVVGRNCQIGKNCILQNAFLFDNVVIEDDCMLQYCVVGTGSKICTKSKLTDGTVVGINVVIPPTSNLSKKLIQRKPADLDDNSQKIGSDAFIIDETEETYSSDSDDEEIVPERHGIPKMSELPYNHFESDYDSTSEEEQSRTETPPPDNNLFLTEVRDSLLRGYTQNLNPDYLILEINSSRYAYNMSLPEVNYYVSMAVILLTLTKEDANVIEELKKILKSLGPLLKNYIKSDDSMRECLKSQEACCNEHPELKAKAAQIVHCLYDEDIVSEDAILSWYKDGLSEESEWVKEKLKALINWLLSSEEESSEDE